MPEQPITLYDIIGEDGFTRLVEGFYRRVREDDVLAPMYPADDWAGAECRLRGFLVFRFGGPEDYVMQRGHPRLRMRHMPFAIDQAARDRWVKLMDEAMAEARLPRPVVEVLDAFFRDTATFMINRG